VRWGSALSALGGELGEVRWVSALLGTVVCWGGAGALGGVSWVSALGVRLSALGGVSWVSALGERCLAVKCALGECAMSALGGRYARCTGGVR
jgi:hypothetical protein